MSEHSSSRNDAELAVALHYDGEGAPEVTAKGRRKLAAEILELAESHGIPIHEDPELVQFLARLEVGDQIPRALYVAVAEVIAFAYWVSGRSPKNTSDQDTDGTT
ncbi:EscU/YscU/HrcU family type III secretion system export apparatus switch protein [Gammaproteobacteria bacterium AB-CW1]|uniref:Flagellar biosynthetic protein FlhB n=1 Tax=Natronospira elongata TaxID=3110268 RepID=A0AAP6MKI0_9GAMM|nr:EscU/YscU/HrcU family type III secretion system export apparatus switch protein [Gammaproteobacteria bacterium AB-CW1]